jgi:tRNA dimethylallyltransferase
MTDWHHDKDAPHTPSVPLELVVLDRPREVLNQRIGQRVRAMLQAGWIEEVRGLLAEGLSADLHSFKALGYRQIAQRLIDGAQVDDLGESIAKETRQFAKRQRTWFRAMKTATWLDAEDQRQAVAFCEKFLQP